ncbi:restriction endonuclease subunit S [Aestuariivivens insulae]|uniref:restriction endonuclease subunit S n=1 Tax=Aestuariivivens insulae TaxID=1621988 RepID=UPI001F5709C2|nr:restriction endonuclease subunit S [Aestuariivivens insulae]
MEFVEYTIGELALEVKTGKTPPTSNPEYFEGEIPWIGPSDLKGQKLAEDSERKISDVALEDKKAFLYQSGTVLISTIGDIGKTAIVKKPVASNQQLTGILVNEEIILPELFYYWIRLNKRVLENKANTSVLSMLNNKLIKRIRVVFPKDFEDQYKVVGRLNRIQELIDKRVETIQLLDEYIRSAFFEIFGDPVTNSKGFKQLSLSHKKFKITSGITPSRKNESYFSGNIPWAKSTDMKGEVIKNTEETISDLAIQKTNAKIFPKDSVLIAMYGQGKTRGNVGLLDINSSCNQACAVIFPNDLVTPHYLFSQLKYSYDYLRSIGKGGNQNNLSLETLKRVKINIPPSSFQERYSSLFHKIHSQQRINNQSLEILEIFFKATLQNAFSPESQINEEEVFESLLQTFTKEDLKQGERLKHLLKWIDCKEPRFSQLESYDLAWERLRELLEDGSIEQILDENEIKLKVVE